MEIATEQRFPHYAPHDDYELSEGHILTFLSGAHRDISNGRQQQAAKVSCLPLDVGPLRRPLPSETILLSLQSGRVPFDEFEIGSADLSTPESSSGFVVKESENSPVVFQKEPCHIDGMTIKHLTLLTVVLIGSLTASAQNIKRIPLPASQNPTGADLPIAAAVWVGDTLYVSGWLDPDIKTHPDTTSQTVGLLKDIQKFLEAQKLTLADVVMIMCTLGAIPGKTARWTLPG